MVLLSLRSLESTPPRTMLLDNELACLMRSIKRVGSVIEKVYGADALTIACQACTPMSLG
jgi:hypothetical protein